MEIEGAVWPTLPVNCPLSLPAYHPFGHGFATLLYLPLINPHKIEDGDRDRGNSVIQPTISLSIVQRIPLPE